MNERELKDGTWTQRVVTHRGPVWRTIIRESSLEDGRFRRARFVLEGGPTIVVSAEELRQVVAHRNPRHKSLCPLRINPTESTINGEKVEIQTQD
jgi:hypothetical protein